MNDHVEKQAPAMDDHPFTYGYYRRMLQAAIGEGYVVSSFEKFDAVNNKTVIMRHDVDYTPNGVLQMATVEHKLGVSATYLFRVHAHEYNLFTPHVYMLVRHLRSLGHEIGLHFEATTVGRAIEMDMKELLLREKSVMEKITGLPIRTASEHRDLSHVVHNSPYFHDVHSPYDCGFDFYAMDPAYCKEMKYLSDSNGVWREGDLLLHLGKHERFQILTHPDWWFEKDLLLKGPYFHGLGN